MIQRYNFNISKLSQVYFSPGLLHVTSQFRFLFKMENRKYLSPTEVSGSGEKVENRLLQTKLDLWVSCRLIDNILIWIFFIDIESNGRCLERK